MFEQIPPKVFRTVWPILYLFLLIVIILFYLYPPTDGGIYQASEIFFWVGILLNIAWPYLYFHLKLRNLSKFVSYSMLILATATLVLFASGDDPIRWVYFTLYLIYTVWLFFAYFLLQVKQNINKVFILKTTANEKLLKKINNTFI